MSKSTGPKNLPGAGSMTRVGKGRAAVRPSTPRIPRAGKDVTPARPGPDRGGFRQDSPRAGVMKTPKVRTTTHKTSPSRKGSATGGRPWKSGKI